MEVWGPVIIMVLAAFMAGLYVGEWLTERRKERRP